MEMLQEMADGESGITPQALLNRPTLSARLMFHYTTYLEIGSSRRVTASGPEPLLWGPFLDYCQLYQIPHNDRLWMWEGVKLFDDQAMTLSRDKMKAESEAAKTK